MKLIILCLSLLLIHPTGIYCQSNDSIQQIYSFFPFPSKIRRACEYKLPVNIPVYSQGAYLLHNETRKNITNSVYTEVCIPVSPIKSLHRKSMFSLEIGNPGDSLVITSDWKARKNSESMVDGLVFKIPVDKIDRLKSERLYLSSDFHNSGQESEDQYAEINNAFNLDSLEMQVRLPVKTRVKSGYQIIIEGDGITQLTNPFKVQRKIPAVIWIPVAMVGLPVLEIAAFVIVNAITGGFDM